MDGLTHRVTAIAVYAFGKSHFAFNAWRRLRLQPVQSFGKEVETAALAQVIVARWCCSGEFKLLSWAVRTKIASPTTDLDLPVDAAMLLQAARGLNEIGNALQPGPCLQIGEQEGAGVDRNVKSGTVRSSKKGAAYASRIWNECMLGGHPLQRSRLFACVAAHWL